MEKSTEQVVAERVNEYVQREIGAYVIRIGQLTIERDMAREELAALKAAKPDAKPHLEAVGRSH